MTAHAKELQKNNGLKERVTVFEPSPFKDPFDEFPELRDIEEFSALTPNEYRFCYYYANRTSEFYYTTPRNVKLSKCYDKAFGVRGSVAEKSLYLTEAFPESVTAGISRMRLVDPDVRTQAKEMVESIFKNFQKILLSARTDDMDGSELKEYASTAKMINEELDGLVDKLEHPFGVKVVKSKNGAGSPDDTIFDKAINLDNNRP